MSDDETAAAPTAPGAPSAAAGGVHHSTGPHGRLSPVFWPTNPAAWFTMAEGQFILRNISEELMRYYHVLTCLPESTINLVTEFREGRLPPDLYTQLKGSCGPSDQR